MPERSTDNQRMPAATVGDLAPDFVLNDERGKPWQLSERRGRVIALLFYPGDETLVCTRQLCSIRDRWNDYVKTEAEIVGISAGTSESHKRFAEHYSLPLTLLVDSDRRVTGLYTTHWLLPIWARRAVVVIDAEGFIRSRQVQFKIFRPSDAKVMAAIHLAKYDKLANQGRQSLTE